LKFEKLFKRSYWLASPHINKYKDALVRIFLAVKQ